MTLLPVALCTVHRVTLQMVAKQLRTVFPGSAPAPAVSAGLGSSRRLYPYSRCVVASNYPAEARSASEGGDEPTRLPFRAGGANHPTHSEARAELRDRETYYA